MNLYDRSSDNVRCNWYLSAADGPYLVGFEVFTAATMKIVVLLDVAPCRSCENRRLRRTRLHLLQGRKHSRESNKASSWLAYC
jgi:hypothetical protein